MELWETQEKISGLLSLQEWANPMMMFDASAPTGSVWEEIRPEQRDFDVVGVRPGQDSNAPDEIWIANRDDSWAKDARALEKHAERVAREAVLPASASMEVVVARLRTHPFVVCRQEDGGLRIANRSDLVHPMCRIWLFAALASLESVLSELYPTMSDRRWRQYLAKNDLVSVNNLIRQMKDANSFVADEYYLNLRHKLDVATAVILPSPYLCYETSNWRTDVNNVVRLRNAVCHDRIESSPDASNGGVLLEQIESLDRLFFALKELHASSEHVWDAYARTELLERRPGDEQLVPMGAARLEGPVWVISAQNPFERLLSDLENASRHRDLVAICRADGTYVCEGVGRAPRTTDTSGAVSNGAETELDAGAGWAEEMVFVHPSSPADGRGYALGLARRFRQRGVFEIDAGALRVVDARDGSVRRMRNLMKS